MPQRRRVYLYEVNVFAVISHHVDAARSKPDADPQAAGAPCIGEIHPCAQHSDARATFPVPGHQTAYSMSSLSARPRGSVVQAFTVAMRSWEQFSRNPNEPYHAL